MTVNPTVTTHSSRSRSRWASLLPAGCILLLTGAAGSLYLATSAQGPVAPVGPLQPEPAFVDLGVIDAGEEREARFSLQNTTNAPIRLLEVVTGCSCTTASVSRHSIRPDENTEIVLRFTAGENGGRAERTIAVHYMVAGEVVLRTVPLGLVASIRAEYEISPSRLEFVVGRSESQMLTITPYTPEFKVLGATSSHPALQVVEETIAGRAPTVTFKFNSTLWTGMDGNIQVVVETTGKRNPRIGIPVRIINGDPHARGR